MDISHDAEVTVKRAADALATMRGCVITGTVIRVLGELVALELPGLAPEKIDHHLALVFKRGELLSDEKIMEVAGQLVSMTISSFFIGIDYGKAAGTVFTLIGPRGEKLAANSIGEVLRLARELGAE